MANWRRLIGTLALAGLILSSGGVSQVAAQGAAPAFATQAFERVWTRTDAPVAEGRAGRTWFWGPQPTSPGLREAYTDAPDGSGTRLVQYYDKSRMEINDANADSSSPFYVTNGLLSVELISGCIQMGQQACGEQRSPANIPMSGDAGDQLAPTYAAFGAVSNTTAGDHPTDNRINGYVTATIDRNGTIGDDPSKASTPKTRVAYFEALTGHNVPEAFWNFLNQSGLVRQNGRLTSGPLIDPWYYASGLPISEAYWARATIGGEVKEVMIQAFERRILTYVPTNAPAWQVEMGNIGQHYYNWRYIEGGTTPVSAETPAPDATATATPEPAASPTEETPRPIVSPIGPPEIPPSPGPTPALN